MYICITLYINGKRENIHIAAFSPDGTEDRHIYLQGDRCGGDESMASGTWDLEFYYQNHLMAQ